MRALDIFLGARRVGMLVQHAERDSRTTRFLADSAFASDLHAPTLSLSMKAAVVSQQPALWADVRSATFHGTYSERNEWRLPSFFQNLLPEGQVRTLAAQQCGCDREDAFALLAALGDDLAGDVRAVPSSMPVTELKRLLGMPDDLVEVELPLELLPMHSPGAVALCGVQPKIGVFGDGERFGAKQPGLEATFVAKLPSWHYDMLPEVEHLSLELARLAGAQVVDAALVPLHRLDAPHDFDIPTLPGSNFLAVKRYDRPTAHGARFHAEDFAQILGALPERKYSSSYLEVAATLLSLPSLGEAAVHELLRRVFINELLGNPDMHLKNIGVLYDANGLPSLPPAYDIVAFSAYGRRTGRALHLFPLQPGAPKPKARAGSSAIDGRAFQLGPMELRQFCERLSIPEKPASTMLQKVARLAFERWPERIEASTLTATMKKRIVTQLFSHRAMESLLRRNPRIESLPSSATLS